MMEGNNAKKKLKASDDALMFSEPFIMPFKKNRETTYKDIPLNPGSLILLLALMILEISLLFNKPLIVLLGMSYIAFRLKSRLFILWVNAPTEIKSTPHFA